MRFVVVAGGGFLELGQLGLDRGGVAAGADALDAVDLLALQRGVDAEDLDLAVVALGVGVHADQRALRRSRTRCWSVYAASAISRCGKPRLTASTIPPSSSIFAKYAYA